MYPIIKFRCDLQIILTVFILVLAANNKTAAAKPFSAFTRGDSIAYKDKSEIHKDSITRLTKTGETYPSSAVTRLSPESFENNTQPGIQSALQGKATGAYIQGGSGKLGQLINVRIRGTSSINGNNQPLYVIDGMPFTDLFPNYSENEAMSSLTFLNPADIEKIEIIRDGSAAAHFGSLASNGAIVITTKRGHEGKTRFSFNSQLGVTGPSNKIGFLNRQQYLSLVEEGYNNVISRNGEDAYDWLGLSPGDSWPQILDMFYTYWRDPQSPDNMSLGPDTNWEDKIFRNGFTHQYTLDAKGGGDFYAFFTSLSFYNQQSFIIEHDFERISGRINLDLKPFKKMKISLNLNPSRTKSLRTPHSRHIISPMIMSEFSPLEPLYIPGTKELNDIVFYTNPLIAFDYYENTSEFINGLGNLSIQYSLLNNLNLTAEWSGNLVQMKEYSGNIHGYPQEEIKISSKNSFENYYLTFQQNLGEFIGFKIISGFSNTRFKDEMNISKDAPALSGEFDSERNLSGYYISSFFSFKDILFLEPIVRMEKSSVFSEKNRQKIFPSAAASWILVNNPNSTRTILPNYLKAKLSYGISGSDEIQMEKRLYSLPNPDLTWQTIEHFNAGIDFGFANNQFTGEVNFYNKNSRNGFVAKPIPATFWISYMAINSADISNTGFEFVLNYTKSIGEFHWLTSFNIATNTNKITNLKDITYLQSENTRIAKNYPVGSFWMPIYAGPDPDNGDALFYTDNTRTNTTIFAPFAEPQFAGDPNPEFFGGLTNHFKYKKWDLTFSLQFVYGNDVYNYDFINQASGLDWFTNQTVYYYENYWKKPGDKTKYPQPRFLEGNWWGQSSMLLFDGSYLRLKDITLGYSIKPETLQRLRINSLRIFIRGLNLLTFTKYPGWDPEASYYGVYDAVELINANNIKQGYDYMNPPQSRVFTFGINMQF